MHTASSTAKRFAQLALVLLLALLMASGSALAQRNKKSADEKDPLYPNATREEPEGKTSQRMAPKLQKVQDAFYDEKYDQALELAQEIIDNKRANEYERSFATQVQAHVAVEQDDYPRAIGLMQKALEINGLSNDAHYQMMYQVAQMQLAEEQYDAALKTLERFVTETRSEDPKIMALRGNAMYRMERYEEAVPLLRQAIDATDKPEESWLQLLMATYFEMDKPSEAAAIAEQLVARSPDDKTLVRNLSSIYLQADQNEKAAKVLEDAKARGMLTEAEDYEQLYKLYYYIEQEDKAIATINEGIEKGILPPSAEVYRIVGDAHYFSERIPQAAEAYGKGAALAKDGELDLLHSRVLHELDRHAEAKAAAQRAVDRGVKRKGDAYLLLGAAAFGLGDKEGAVAAYKQAAKFPESKTMAETWLRQSGRM